MVAADRTGVDGPIARGDHACLFYGDVEERRGVAETVIRDAWARGERVLWLGCPPETAAEGFRDDPSWLWKLARDRPTSAEESLHFVDIRDYVTDEGELDRVGLIHLLKEEMILALVDGHEALQVIQDVSAWSERLEGEMDTIRQYETELSTFLPGSWCSVLCLYDRHGRDPHTRLKLLETHPHAVVEGVLCENIYAIPPDDLLDLQAPSSTFRRRLANLVEHRDAEDARKRHTDLIELLHAVSQMGHEASTVDELVHLTLDRICSHLGWPVGHAFRTVDGDEPVLDPTALWYLDDEEGFRTFRQVTEATRYPPGVGLPGQVLASREPVWIEDVGDEPEFRRTLSGHEMGIRSAFAVPIKANSEVLGVLEFFSGDRRPEDPRILQIVAEAASQLAVAMERKQAEEELRLLESGVRHVKDAIVITTPDLEAEDGPEIVYVNPAFETITGYSAEEARGARLGLLYGPKTDDVVRRRAGRALSEGRSASGEVIAYRKDGSEFVLQWQVAPVRGPGGRVTHFVSVQRDMTDQRRAEDAIRRADHDSLTGLPNRDLFMRRLERSVERARKEPEEGRFAVLFLDLDRFKVINDSLGHLRGDQLLVSLGRRLEQSVRPGDIVARFGGDEFVILLDRVEDVSDATRVAERIQEALSAPFDVGGDSVYTSASVGIALSDTGYLLPEDVLRDADAAMYRAKSDGKDRYEVFDQALFDDAVTTLRLETDLRKAIEEGQFELRYQPIVSLDDGRTRGLEALLRWNHPERGLMVPRDFLELAVETGLIVPIGRWVLDEACRQMQAWQAKYHDATHLSLSVNFSAPEFGNGHDVPEIIDSALRSHELMAGTLQLEITENVLIDRPKWVERTLSRIREMGVRICLDDFGTGYSSLSYLHQFPVEVLKVDRLFVGRLGEGNGSRKRNEEIVRAILGLARNLDLDVTAEGVETGRQVRSLRGMECPTAQGFYFSRPLQGREVERLFKGESLPADRRTGGDGDGGT